MLDVLRRYAALVGMAVLVLAGCSRQAAVIPVADPTPGAHDGAADDKAKGKEPERTGTTFALPADAVGPLLARVLAPTGLPDGIDHRSAPLPRAMPSSMQPPTGPLTPPPALGLVPALPSAMKKAEARPQFVTEEVPTAPEERVALPEAQQLPAPPRARVASPDVNQPLALPILAQPVPERAPVDDATTDASTAAVLAAVLPPRSAPAPFLRLVLPDPFENRRPLTVALPAEHAEPTAANPQTPRR